jgi:hypothetical protein
MASAKSENKSLVSSEVLDEARPELHGGFKGQMKIIQ